MDLSHHRRYSRSHYRNSSLCTLYLPGRFLILAQETLFTTSPTEPSVVHVCTIASPEIHFTHQSHSSQSYQLPPPSAIPTPSVHTKKKPQLCYSMLSCSAPCRNSLCFLLMSLEQAHNGSTCRIAKSTMTSLFFCFVIIDCATVSPIKNQHPAVVCCRV